MFPNRCFDCGSDLTLVNGECQIKYCKRKYSTRSRFSRLRSIMIWQRANSHLLALCEEHKPSESAVRDWTEREYIIIAHNIIGQCNTCEEVARNRWAQVGLFTDGLLPTDHLTEEEEFESDLWVKSLSLASQRFHEVGGMSLSKKNKQEIYIQACKEIGYIPTQEDINTFYGGGG